MVFDFMQPHFCVMEVKWTQSERVFDDVFHHLILDNSKEHQQYCSRD